MVGFGRIHRDPLIWDWEFEFSLDVGAWNLEFSHPSGHGEFFSRQVGLFWFISVYFTQRWGNSPHPVAANVGPWACPSSPQPRREVWCLNFEISPPLPGPRFLRIFHSPFCILHSLIGGWTLTVHGKKFLKSLSLIINHLRQSGSFSPISAFCFLLSPFLLLPFCQRSAASGLFPPPLPKFQPPSSYFPSCLFRGLNFCFSPIGPIDLWRANLPPAGFAAWIFSGVWMLDIGAFRRPSPVCVFAFGSPTIRETTSPANAISVDRFSRGISTPGIRNS
jgi:hypothetical protein